MQNKPNPQNQETTLTPYPKKNYAKTSPLRPQKNKPKTNPIPNKPSAPRPHKSTSCLPPAIKTAIPTTSGSRNFALCLLPFDFSLPTLSPKSAQLPASAPKLSAKTSKNHHPFAQNKPNPKNTKPNLTHLLPMIYINRSPLPTQKNKPKTNPIKPNPPARIDETNPIQTQPNPILPSPKLPTPPNHPQPKLNPAETKIRTPHSPDMPHKPHKCRILLLLTAALILIAPRPAAALIFHPNGEPNLANWTDRPHENTIGRWDPAATCIVISPNCVITTRHQKGGTETPVRIAGTTYSISQIWDHNEADLRLARLHNANLPNFVDIYDQTNETAHPAVLAGYGVGAAEPLQTQGQTYGYNWDDYASRALRIGTNRFEDTKNDDELAGFTSDIVIGDFDALAEGNPTAYETIPAAYDSGGGCFIKIADTWKLAAIIRAVETHFAPEHDDDPNYILYEAWFRERNDPNTPHPDYFDAVRVSSYAQWIRETIPPVLPGDLTGDDYVNNADFAVFAQQWRRSDCRQPDYCLGADHQPNGKVDELDLAHLAQNWLKP